MALTFRHLLISVLALVALALAMPGGAAASGDDVLAECFKTGDVQPGRYSKAELREARRGLAADGDAYSECRDIISGLLARANISGNGPPGDGDDADKPGGGASGGGGSSAGGSVFDANGSSQGGPGSPEEAARRRELARADTDRRLGDRAFDPRGDGASINSGGTSNGLPLPVVLALAALTLLLATGALLAVHQRNPAFMGALRRVPFGRSRR